MGPIPFGSFLFYSMENQCVPRAFGIERRDDDDDDMSLGEVRVGTGESWRGEERRGDLKPVLYATFIVCLSLET